MTGRKALDAARALNFNYFSDMFDYHKKARFVTDLLPGQLPGVEFRVPACLLFVSNVDLGLAALTNGAARTAADASPAYRQAEAEAKKSKRGIYQ